MDDDGLLPLSALQHFVFCPRQCALIHLERAWADNRLTAEGNILHERVIAGDTTARAGVQTCRSLPLRSVTLGLIGLADVVEFIPGPDGRDQAYPVEYKRGRTKPHDADRVQLCAQALCLEEMLGRTVPEGAIFYGEPRRREPVTFTPALRDRTRRAAADLHGLIAADRLPPAIEGAYCRSCSLIEICCPGLAARRSVAGWVERLRRGD